MRACVRVREKDKITGTRANVGLNNTYEYPVDGEKSAPHHEEQGEAMEQEVDGNVNVHRGLGLWYGSVGLARCMLHAASLSRFPRKKSTSRSIDGDADGKLDALVFFAFYTGLEGTAEHGDNRLTRVFQDEALDHSEEENLDLKEC